MKTKTFFALFSNTHSIGGIELTYLKSMKLGSNFVKFQLQSISSKIEQAFKKEQNFPSQLGQKGN